MARGWVFQGAGLGVSCEAEKRSPGCILCGCHFCRLARCAHGVITSTSILAHRAIGSFLVKRVLRTTRTLRPRAWH